MPLEKGCSEEVRQRNIDEMIDSGRSPDVAAAAAWRQFRES